MKEKKILAILGSPHTDGTTSIMLECKLTERIPLVSGAQTTPYKRAVRREGQQKGEKFL